MRPLAIETENLVKRFGSTVAVDGLSLQVHAGECVALLGPNGAGKTTTLEMLEGLQRPTSGTVRIFGMSWDRDASELRARIGLQLQHTRFYEYLTVEEMVALFRSFYARPLPVSEVIERVGLQEKRTMGLAGLSGGQAQRLSLALALVADPQLLFLDEPTAALDPQSRHALWQTIEGLKQDGRTIVITTHYLEEAERLCERVVVVDRGRLIADGTPMELITQLAAKDRIELHTVPELDAAIFAAIPGVLEVKALGGNRMLAVSSAPAVLPAVVKTVADRGANIVALTTRAASLEDAFLSLTGHGLRE